MVNLTIDGKKISVEENYGGCRIKWNSDSKTLLSQRN